MHAWPPYADTDDRLDRARVRPWREVFGYPKVNVKRLPVQRPAAAYVGLRAGDDDVDCKVDCRVTGGAACHSWVPLTSMQYDDVACLPAPSVSP